jgi:threonine dehydrogenase-like Zn-dependent dehydrogenase
VGEPPSTPYQAMERAEVTSGDLVVVIGAGGIGTYAVQIARARGARVAVIDIDPVKLERLEPFKTEWSFDAREIDGSGIKKRLLGNSGVNTSWKIFEMSGTAAGQELAWSLLVHGSDARHHRLHDGQGAGAPVESDGARRAGVRQPGLQPIALRRRAGARGVRTRDVAAVHRAASDA